MNITTTPTTPTWSHLDLQPRIVVVADCGYGSYSSFSLISEAFLVHFPTGVITLTEPATGHGFPVATYDIDLQDQERFLRWYAYGEC